MKKLILAVLSALSIFSYSETIKLSNIYNSNATWSVITADSQKVPAVNVLITGNPYKEIKTVDIDNPGGDMYIYKGLTLLRSDGAELEFVKVETAKNKLKSTTTNYSNLKEVYKNWDKMAMVSKSSDDEIIGIFQKDAYKDIKVFNKGNKTIVKYFDVYFIFDKGDCEFKDATGWN